MSILTESQLATFDFARGFGMKTNSSEDVAATLNDVISALGSAVIAGGMAVIHYGYERYTKDIDVLYAAADTKILKRFESAFYIDRQAAHGGWQYLTHKKTGIKLKLVPEGGRSAYGFIPGPQAAGREKRIRFAWRAYLAKTCGGPCTGRCGHRRISQAANGGRGGRAAPVAA